MRRSQLTRSGTRRLGDDYQDLVACEVLIDWLEHSGRYQWVKVEADEAKYLDDVTALRADGRLDVKQVKFSTNPEAADDPLTWEKLLARPTGTSDRARLSLLEKWFTSLEELSKLWKLGEAAVLTNRSAGPDLRASLDAAANLVNYDLIADETLREEIARQLGGEDKAVWFFSQFRFRLNEPSLSELEHALRRRFDRLGGTEAGWFNLKNEIRFWVSHKNEPQPDGAIRLADVKRAARWHPLQALPQRFVVPDDYVIPSEDFHEELRRALLLPGGSCRVLTASPGVGKSTYTSALYDQLKDEDAPVIRHHYYLSLDDPAAAIRLSHVRAAESLMHDLKFDYPEALGPHTEENPQALRLREWVDVSGRYFARQGKQLIVIVDGLDHVWRDTRSIDELTRLLNFLLPAPEGVVVLLATQPVDENMLPPQLSRFAPRETWLHLPLMEERAVREWLRHHEAEIFPQGPEVEDAPAQAASPQPDGRQLSEHRLKNLAEALYRKSSGHPLHLRYTLRALYEQGMLVTSENIERLPGCAHKDIRDYYAELWRVLPEEGRAILHLLTATRFPWPKRGILECLNPEGTGYASLNAALRQVEHLLVDDELGLRPFHGSLFVFIESLGDHENYADVMRRNALNWLRRGAPEYFKWAHEWMLEADLGNDQPLSEGPSRAWLIDSVAKHYSSEESLSILSRSIWCSLNRRDLPRAVEVGLLHDYCFRAFQFDPDIYERLLYSQLEVAEDPHLRPRLRARLASLDDSTVAVLARHEAKNGNVAFVRTGLDELARRTRTEDELTHPDWRSLSDAILKVAALLDDLNPAKAVDYILSNRESGEAPDMLLTFATALRTVKNVRLMRQTLDLRHGAPEEFDVNMTRDERSILLRQAILLALEEGLDLDEEIKASENSSDPFCLIYAAIRQTAGFQPAAALMPNVVRPQRTRPRLHGRPDADGGFFYSCFFGLLANYLWGAGALNAEWLRADDVSALNRSFLVWLDSAAKEVAESILAGTPLAVGLLYTKLKSLPQPPESKGSDLEVMGFKNSVERTLKSITLDFMALAGALDRTPEISKTDLEAAFSSGYCYQERWMDDYVERGRPWLSAEALAWLLDSQAERLTTSIEQFPERASTYSTLASLATLHREEEVASGFIQQAASNLVAHGNHKDLLFFHVLHATQVCHQAGVREATEWVLRVAPAISHIEEFTDGDETGDAPRRLADVLWQVTPELLPVYYAWLHKEEEDYDALNALHVFIKTADLSSPFNRAVAETAVDDKGVMILAKRAEAGDEHAQVALSSILSLLGEKALEKISRETSRSSSSSYEKQPPPVVPSDYPPGRLMEFVAALDTQEYIWKDESVGEWIKHWVNGGRAEAVFQEVERAIERGVELRDYDVMFDLALRLYGRERAYPWLVKAHAEQRGWNRYYTSEEKAFHRWSLVERHYPQRWFDFIQRTLQKGHAVPWEDLYLDAGISARLIEYCVQMKQVEIARLAAEKLVAGSMQLVSPITLQMPEWARGA